MATGLKRTASVKETARERSEYLNPYLRAIREPTYRRLRRGARDPSPAVGVTSSQFFTFTPSPPIVPLDTSKEREMISRVDDEIIERRKVNRSLRVQSLAGAAPWRRKTVHTSQPYSPLADYHESRSRRSGRTRGATEFLRPVHYPAFYRKSLEDLQREEEAAAARRRLPTDVAGAVALSKYYRAPKHIRKVVGKEGLPR